MYLSLFISLCVSFFICLRAVFLAFLLLYFSIEEVAISIVVLEVFINNIIVMMDIVLMVEFN